MGKQINRANGPKWKGFDMTRFLICAVVMVACMTLCSTVYSQTDWQAVGLASDSLVSGRLLYTPPGRVSVGGDVGWLDGLDNGQFEGWRFAFVGTYDLIDAAPLKIPVVGEIPATWYIGGLGGVLVKDEPDDGIDFDATAALMTGLVLSSEKASIGVEWQYLLTDALWQPLADIDDSSRLLFYAALRF